ncbi:DeoR/GlpR family DNA-binding transcription regulator [Clostridium felsineum]|uniref:HTH-type transcriptional regulator YdjF n=1 Tax=Clostridium felsineum TaxID=36839 RepID=A0A1S8MBJ8_9CLOT|nr:DeoR/GlpR family DNA-binding transcription regulator [Clostridium felsineum]MCR3758966.1 DeoR/GlpR family DNA-binding transcription regulator [Clostridium felsineum]URZ02675.1 putative HTH-type transcriptional regulator YdjF [Clostridium felsineum]URZ09002.1 putative HTH-type transcriptional regulator YdjF [Clostridium felsineum]URZ09630.1 putative HTH-type transcriptional regulator YdjF [Clostridium felsineum]
MFARERYDIILELLNREGKVIVKDLSSRFNVTEDCIRKDLRYLENNNFLKRTYGGAIPIRKTAHYNKISDRRSANVREKLIIAKKAFDLIEDDETIFLDISTTNIMLAELLSKSDKKVTVITNMIDIISVLNMENNIKVISTGGVLSKDLNGYACSMTIDVISNYKFNKAFIGSCGVDLYDNSVTTFEVEDGNTKKAIMRNSKVVYIVMDNSKFYFGGTYKFAHFEDIDVIVTDKIPSDQIVGIMKKNDVNII